MDRDTGRQFRIGTIVPKVDEQGRCIFLTEDQRCSIHAVAPFGCAYFDTHMAADEGHARSIWGLRTIQSDPEYLSLREALLKRDAGVMADPVKSGDPPTSDLVSEEPQDGRHSKSTRS